MKKTKKKSISTINVSPGKPFTYPPFKDEPYFVREGSLGLEYLMFVASEKEATNFESHNSDLSELEKGNASRSPGQQNQTEKVLEVYTDLISIEVR